MTVRNGLSTRSVKNQLEGVLSYSFLPVKHIATGDVSEVLG